MYVCMYIYICIYIERERERESTLPKKIRRQETSNSVGGRRSLYQIQATAAMEEQQVRLDMIPTAAAGPSIYIYLYI